MGFFDFVQQDDRIGRAAHAFGELAALFVADIAWRRADQLRYGMLLHVFRHIEANERLLAAEEELGEPASHFGLAHAGGAKEQETSDGAARRFEAGAAAANGASQGGDGLFLADDALMQFLFDAQQFLLLVFLDGGDRHAGPARNDFLDVFARHDAGGRIIELQTLAQLAQIIFFFAFFFGIETRLFKLMIGNGRFHAMGDEFHALLHLGHFVGKRGLAQLHARARFVDQVDGFVGKETVRNVAAGKIDGILDGFIGIADGVEFFVTLADALQNANGFFFRGAIDLHGLEAALEGTIFFDGLAVFAGRGGADALDFAAAQSRLQDVGGIERAFGRTGAQQAYAARR